MKEIRAIRLGLRWQSRDAKRNAQADLFNPCLLKPRAVGAPRVRRESVVRPYFAILVPLAGVEPAMEQQLVGRLLRFVPDRIG